MPPNLETLTAILLTLTAIVLIVIIMGLGIITFYAVMLCLRHLQAQNVSQNPSATVAEAKTIPETKPAPKVVKDPPGRSCGHCGTRIKTEPIRAVATGTAQYHVYACPVCKKETLL